MRVFIIGIQGVGKSYLVNKMREKRFNAIDVDDKRYGLAKHVDEKGKEAKLPELYEKEWWLNHYYVYDVNALEKLLKDNETLYLFGSVGGQPGKGNGDEDVMKLFDRVYYLDATKSLIAKRLVSRPGYAGKSVEEVERMISWKDEQDAKMRNLHIPFIDATLPTDEVIRIIISQE